MIQRGSFQDDAVAIKFVATNEKCGTKKKIYPGNEEAKIEIFEFFEMYKLHSHTGAVYQNQFEKDYFSRLESAW